MTTSTTIHIDKSTALDHLRAVVAEDPDRKAACQYATDYGQPCCIVGQVFHRAGVSVETLARLDHWVSDDLDGTDLRQLHENYALKDVGIDLDEDALEVLRTAQSYQDMGQTWGNALAQAESGVIRL